jgi:hypothetical protein
LQNFIKGSFEFIRILVTCWHRSQSVTAVTYISFPYTSVNHTKLELIFKNSLINLFIDQFIHHTPMSEKLWYQIIYPCINLSMRWFILDSNYLDLRNSSNQVNLLLWNSYESKNIFIVSYDSAPLHIPSVWSYKEWIQRIL